MCSFERNYDKLFEEYRRMAANNSELTELHKSELRKTRDLERQLASLKETLATVQEKKRKYRAELRSVI